MKKLSIIFTGLLLMAGAVYAVESGTKPADHTSAWTEELHGKKANANVAECYTCHTERLECITCHEDTKPRSHTVSWTNRVHGLKARFAKDECKSCHTEDSCISCHDTMKPARHDRLANGAHCSISCQAPVGQWKNTVSKDCITCHRKKPLPTHVP
jgi:hypothetical protein